MVEKNAAFSPTAGYLVDFKLGTCFWSHVLTPMAKVQLLHFENEEALKEFKENLPERTRNSFPEDVRLLRTPTEI